MEGIRLPLDRHELRILFKLVTAEMDRAAVKLSESKRSGNGEALDKSEDDYAVLKFLWTKLVLEINREA